MTENNEKVNKNIENIQQNQNYPMNNSMNSIQSNNFPQQYNYNIAPSTAQFIPNQLMNFQQIPMVYNINQSQIMPQFIPFQNENLINNINYSNPNFQKIYNHMKKKHEQNNLNIAFIKKELEGRKKKRQIERQKKSLVLFFNYKGKIVPIDCNADDLILQTLEKYKTSIHKEEANLKFRYKEKELKMDLSAKKLYEEDILNGEEIIVED